MEFPKLKKQLRVLLSSLGRVNAIPRKILLSVGFLSLASGSHISQPPVLADPKVTVKTNELSKFSVKYLLRSASNSLGQMLAQHRSHSSHSSHRSHSSHYSGSSPGHRSHNSHSSHYSSSYPGTTPPPSPTPRPPTHNSHSSHYSSSGTTPARSYPDTLNVPSATRPRSTRSTVVLGDSFGAPLSKRKWRVGTLTGSRVNLDREIPIAAEGGRLEVTPRTSRPSRSFSGFVTILPRDMTSAHARVEVVQATENTADTIFAVGQDSNNWYGFVKEGDKLYLQIKVAGKKHSENVVYDPAEHRYWRLRHEATENLMLWETSADGTTWAILRSAQPEIPLTSLYVYAGAGTYVVEGAPGKAVFDNFKFVIHTER